ncbi:response regulator [Paenibacillus chartarius]|uniref:Response regulator n=1 Tax=Paenibacillus chartarius TaxID=747481 RepID=A0ABV6DPT3_9BACL
MATILIVDDSILMRRNLRMLLTEAGHTVVAEASNGMEAYKEYAKHEPDLVTMDITMPVMDGLESLKKIIVTYPHAKIIMISALDQKNMVFEAIQNGAKHYILKPITLEKILETISLVLDQPAAGKAVSDSAALQPSPKPRDAQAAPFAIDNKNGVFIVSLYAAPDESSLTSIHMALQGFLFVKPLKVIFNFDELEELDPGVVERVKSYMLQIQEAEGTVRVVCHNPKLVQQLKSADEALFAKIHTDMGQVIL